MQSALCECGCGRKTGAGNRFIHGHSSLVVVANRRSADTQSWMAGQQGKHFCRCAACVLQGCVKGTQIAIRKQHRYLGIPRYIKGHNAGLTSKGVRRSEATRSRLSASLREAMNRPECRKKLSAASRKKWRDPSYRQRLMEALRRQALSWGNQFKRRPTTPEFVLAQLLPPQVRYVGDGAWYCRMPNGRNRNPDFKVTGQKKVIELFGDYWHRHDNPETFIAEYREAGLRCLVVWERELYAKQHETVQRCMEFAKEENT